MFFDTVSVKHFESGSAAAAFVADAVSQACKDAVAKRGVFHWVLAGGGTPELSYRLLGDADLHWAAVHIWFGDERALPQGHADRNETMARKALLDVVPIPAANIHSIIFETTTDNAAAAYTEEVKAVDAFDLVLLGMGEDGHTASLFPNNPALSNNALAVPVHNSPKPPAERVSLSFKALNNHRQAMILATGASKADILQAINKGEDLPVCHINDALWVFDQAAWPN